MQALVSEQRGVFPSHLQLRVCDLGDCHHQGQFACVLVIPLLAITATMSEKKQYFTGLPTSAELAGLDRPPRCKRTKALAIGLCLGVLGTGGFLSRTNSPTLPALELSAQVANTLCPQAKPITPIKHSAIWDSLVGKSATDEHEARAIEWLSGAVRVPYVLCSSLALN